MPEGDSAYRAAANLSRSLAGRTVTQFELRLPKLATASLVGEQVTAVDARGKHVLLRIGEFTVHSHFGMDGSWRLVPPSAPTGTGPLGTSSVDAGPLGTGTPRRARTPQRPNSRARRGPNVSWPAAHRIRAIIGTDAVVALGIDLAKLDIWPTAEEEQHLGWLGPDLLAEDPDLIEAVRRLEREPAREISAALLDQRNLAGLGNEYVTEMCFLRGVLPHRRIAECGTMTAWVDLGRKLMLANRDRVERTFTGNLRQPTWVFGRAGEPCRRCGATILKGKHASGSTQPDATERDSVWCPRCQT
ncbi:MAG: DNA-formamidopyrimidine glycosylase family protein [Gulosibacter sp.]|uniref:DNA-formamidopyrimidine glycosylase family protein n=1 Tax=Gulosibacter sp. TaxID=2817531 RepID=UPI003F92C3B8